MMTTTSSTTAAAAPAAAAPAAPASTLQIVSDRVNFSNEEEKILAYWQQIRAFETSLERNKEKPIYTFYDGPPFATGLPHYGHILAGTIKDIVTRYAHQTGHSVSRRFGWDCHGLPVEYEIDQKLGIKTKDDVMKIGVPAYNDACRSIVQRYTKEWESTVKRMGRWIDFEHDYKTMDVSFMESVWWVFRQLFDKGLVYRGYKVMPYSVGCTTALSNFEAGLNYKDVKDPAIVVRFLVKSGAGAGAGADASTSTPPSPTYLLAWTTTPWTLPSNLALAVHPTMEYVRVLDKKTNVHYWMAKTRLEEVYPVKKKGPSQPTKGPAAEAAAAAAAAVPTSTDDYAIVETVRGSALVGTTYEPIFPYFTSHEQSASFWRVIPGQFVTDDSGTGIVHCAPGFGEDDYNVCIEHGVVKKGSRVVCPVDENGRFTSEVTEYAGRFVKDADKDIMRALKERGVMIKQGQIDHSYPFCWRSDSPLLYKAVPSWFVHVEKIKERLLACNEQTYWVPSFVKEKRFHNWLRDARDWAISRTRYWGTPIPIWMSDDEEEIIVVGSIEQLRELSGVQNITDLHKDKIEHITIPSRRGKEYGVLRRVEDVFDCWFESGSMPYAQLHYPFENQDVFKNGFPADFIAEGLDQTRGWFYTLMVISTALFDKPAFSNLIVNGLVLAADGKKMSKRLKNYPDPLNVVQAHSADALRLYLINSPVVRAEPLRFQEAGVHDLVKSVFLPWFHAYRFWVENTKRYEANANTTFMCARSSLPALTNVMDIWLLSSFQSLLTFVRAEMAAYRLYTVIPRLLSFVEQLTNWYVRMNRRRLKAGADQHVALSVLFVVLVDLCRLMAPFTPFFVESMYLNLRWALPPNEREDSVHFLDIPTVDESAKNVAVERVVSRMQTVVELGRVARVNRNLTMKKPLRHLMVLHPDPAYLDDVRSLASYVQSELNVRTVEFSSEQDKYIALSAQANQQKLGKKFGAKFPPLRAKIEALTTDEIRQFQRDQKLTIDGLELAIDEVDVVWSFTGDKTRFESSGNDDALVILNVEEDDELLQEQAVREIMREVQKLRKTSHLLSTDKVGVFYEVEKVEASAAAAASAGAHGAAPAASSAPAASAAAEPKQKGKKGASGKSDAAAAAAAAASAAVEKEVDVEAAIRSNASLIREIIGSLLRPLAVRRTALPVFPLDTSVSDSSSGVLQSPFLLGSAVVELSSTQRVRVHMFRPTVYFDHKALVAFQQQNNSAITAEWLRSAMSLILCKEFSSFVASLRSSNGEFRFHLDGVEATWQCGREFVVELSAE